MVKKERMKIYLFFVVVMVLLLVLAGCGDSKNEGNVADNANNTKVSTDESENKVSEVEGESNTTAPVEELEPVELIWYYLGDETGDFEEVYKQANLIIQEKINATVDFRPMSNGDFKTKMPLKVASSEKFDLAYTADYIFEYVDNVNKGAFIPLDELVDQYAPQTKGMIPSDIWKATIVDGKSYGVPNYQVSSRQKALVFKKDIVDKYNLKDQIFAVDKMSDLTPILEVIAENEPGMYATDTPPQYLIYDVHEKENFVEEFDRSVPIGVDYDLKVIDRTKGEYYDLTLADHELSREWQEKGFFHPDSALLKNLNAEKKQGKIFMHSNNFKPGIEADSQNSLGFEVYAVPMGMPILSTGSITATLTAISRTSDNPERAMMLIELLNTDKELFNLLAFGIEGVDYKKTGEDRVEVIGEDPYKAKAWAMGSQFNAYKLPGQADDVWEKTKEFNDSATPAPTLGFSFDSNPVKTELTNMNIIHEKYNKIFGFGMVEDYKALYDEQIAELETAGMQKYIDELQKQLDEWKKTK